MCENCAKLNPQIIGLTEVSLDGSVCAVTLDHENSGPVKGMDGVQCAVYEIKGRTDVDLGVCSVSEGKSTDWQLVHKGRVTRECPKQGNGELRVRRVSGEFVSFVVSDGVIIEIKTYGEDGCTINDALEIPSIEVFQGDCMSWIAETDLIFEEYCYDPKFEDGRFEVIPSNLQFKDEDEV